ncbi:MAG: hypothetical protein ACOC41_02600 [Chitinivibrionales bacterium]
MKHIKKLNAVVRAMIAFVAIMLTFMMMKAMHLLFQLLKGEGLF